MNFDFFKPIESMKQFCDLCVNAEILVLDFPVQSVITSRKAMEYIVRLLYSASIHEDIYFTLDKYGHVVDEMRKASSDRIISLISFLVLHLDTFAPDIV